MHKKGKNEKKWEKLFLYPLFFSCRMFLLFFWEINFGFSPFQENKKSQMQKFGCNLSVNFTFQKWTEIAYSRHFLALIE